MSETYMKVFNHGTGKIDLTRHMPLEMRPTELHYKEDGDVHDAPSFAVVMEHPHHPPVFGQISLHTLEIALAELGYTLYQP